VNLFFIYIKIYNNGKLPAIDSENVSGWKYK